MYFFWLRTAFIGIKFGKALLSVLWHVTVFLALFFYMLKRFQFAKREIMFVYSENICCMQLQHSMYNRFCLGRCKFLHTYLVKFYCISLHPKDDFFPTYMHYRCKVFLTLSGHITISSDSQIFSVITLYLHSFSVKVSTCNILINFFLPLISSIIQLFHNFLYVLVSSMS